MDAIKFLTRQHRRIESLFSRYERSPSKAADLFGLIERALVPHAILEEMYIYPTLRERVPGGEALTEKAIADHSRIERVIKDMESMDPGTSQFDSSMRWVIDTVARHVAEEEQNQTGLFAMLRAALSRGELEELGRTLRAAADITPTRAHPLAPDRPPANMLLGLPVGMADRLRDRLSGRAAASEAAGEDVTRANRRGRRRTPARSRRPATTRKRAATRSPRARSNAASRSSPKRGAKRQAARRQVRTGAKARRR